MNPLLYTAAQVVAMFPPELKVTEYWVNKTARKHGIGTLVRRKLVFTQAQVEKLIEAQALEAQQPKNSPAPRAKRARAVKAQPIPTASRKVAPLQPRPDRARSWKPA